jgi:hypothetical protein
MNKAGELWTLFVEGQSKQKVSKYSKPVPVKDDDFHDFRQAIHTIQRIIQSKALRKLEEATIQDIIKNEIIATHPGAHSFSIQVDFKDTTSETRKKSARLDQESDHLYILDNGREDERAVNLMSPSQAKSKYNGDRLLDDDEADDDDLE